MNPDMVTHPRTNRVQCSLTSLIETNVLPLRRTTIWEKLNRSWMIFSVAQVITYNSITQHNSLVLLRPDDTKAWSSRGSAFFTSHFRPFTVCIRTPSYRMQQKKVVNSQCKAIHTLFSG